MANLAVERQGILKTAIPALAIIEQMAEQRAPVTAFAPHSVAAQYYEALWHELVQTETAGSALPS
jgi:chromosome partitioning protein